MSGNKTSLHRPEAYDLLIVTPLTTSWTGLKPTKRTLEMIRLCFQVWAELDKLETHLASLSKTES